MNIFVRRKVLHGHTLEVEIGVMGSFGKFLGITTGSQGPQTPVEDGFVP